MRSLLPLKQTHCIKVLVQLITINYVKLFPYFTFILMDFLWSFVRCLSFSSIWMSKLFGGNKTRQICERLVEKQAYQNEILVKDSLIIVGVSLENEHWPVGCFSHNKKSASLNKVFVCIRQALLASWGLSFIKSLKKTHFNGITW